MIHQPTSVFKIIKNSRKVPIKIHKTRKVTKLPTQRVIETRFSMERKLKDARKQTKASLIIDVNISNYQNYLQDKQSNSLEQNNQQSYQLIDFNVKKENQQSYFDFEDKNQFINSDLILF